MEKASHKNINAIIIIGTDDSTIFKLASTLNKPCVLINSVDRDQVLDAVSPDHRAIGFTAMQYLLSRGTAVCSRSPACGVRRCMRVWTALRGVPPFSRGADPSVICW